MCRWFHALGVEEGERRWLKTESIPSTVVKWFLLLNTDKAGARVSGCICVQDICPTFITQYFLHRRPSGALASEEAGRRVSPGCCLSITPGMGNMSSLRLSAPWELSAGLEQWYSGDSQLEKGLPPGDLGSVWRHFWFPQQGGGARGWCCQHPVSRGQGCCWTSYQAQVSLHVISTPIMSTVPRLKMLALERLLFLLWWWFYFFILKFYLFINLWLCWVFAAMQAPLQLQREGSAP